MNVRSHGRTGTWAALGSSCFWSQRAFALLLYLLLTSKMWHLHAGIVLCFQVFGLAQFQGERLTALTVLLGLFGLASLPLTYFLHFFFTVSQQACFWVLFCLDHMHHCAGLHELPGYCSCKVTAQSCHTCLQTNTCQACHHKQTDTWSEAKACLNAACSCPVP